MMMARSYGRSKWEREEGEVKPGVLTEGVIFKRDVGWGLVGLG